MVLAVLAVLGRAIWFGAVLVGPESWTTRGGRAARYHLVSETASTTHTPQAGQGELPALPQQAARTVGDGRDLRPPDSCLQSVGVTMPSGTETTFHFPVHHYRYLTRVTCC